MGGHPPGPKSRHPLALLQGVAPISHCLVHGIEPTSLASATIKNIKVTGQVKLTILKLVGVIKIVVIL